MSSPPFTVLMSVYNGARWLEESISSVLNQTFTDFEFLIINDGSTDHSLDIIKRHAIFDGRIRVIDKPNTGLADSLNVGIRQAYGRWIARMDADDLSEPNRLEKQYAIIQSCPSLVLIGTGLRLIDEHGNSRRVYRYPANHETLVARLTTARAFFAHSSAVYLAEAVRSIRGYRPRIKRAQDWDLWLRLSEVGKLACIGAPLVKIRKHADQVSHEESGRRQMTDAYVAMVSYWLRRCGLNDPVDPSCPESDFQVFRTWVAQCMEHERVFAYRAFVNRCNQQFEADGRGFNRILRLFLLACSQPDFGFRYARHFLFGDRLPRKLAVKWGKRNMSCAE